jgi:FkbM family methyltransferase
MKMKHAVQQLLLPTAVNRAVISMMRPFRGRLPARMLTKIPYVGSVKCNLPNGRSFTLHSDGRDFVASAVYWYGIDGVEGLSTRAFIDLLNGVEVVLDVGANSGIYSLIAGSYSEHIRVYGFEPVRAVYEYFANAVSRNQLSNVQPVHGALTNFDGEIEMFVEEGLRLPLSASARQESAGGYGRVEKSPAIMLDSFVAKNEIGKIDLIKLDTETTEPDVLRGGLQTIKKHRPVILCEVQYGATESELNRIFGDLNYRYFLVGSSKLLPKDTIVGDPSGIYNNYLFVPEHRADSVMHLV